MHNFKKQFGQNFLTANTYANYLIDTLNLQQSDIVIEIGPGDGRVTNLLLERCAKVIAIEVDYDLIPKLLMRFRDYNRFDIVHSDILEVNFIELFEKYGIKRPIFVGSLPYNISKQIIYKISTTLQIAESSRVPEPVEGWQAAFIVQKEVGEDYVARPPKSTSLSMLTSLYANVRKHKNIPASQFFPRPKVDGAILHLKSIPPVKNLAELEKIIKLAFTSPRKTLLNNLQSLNNPLISEYIKILGLKPTIRASELDISHWVQLVDLLKAADSAKI